MAIESNPSIAVLIPCYNEEVTIGSVVSDFRKYLPQADIYVYDNNSSDNTSSVAAGAGAICRTEQQPGKGNVVRRMFADIEADVYILVDGDGTYDAASALRLVTPILFKCNDMTVGKRVTHEQSAYREGHRFGNTLLTTAVSLIFGKRFTDVLSGYRALSRRFVKSFPANSKGFEIEAEMSIYALELNLPIEEVSLPYKSRPAGSISKLRTVKDGILILLTMVMLLRDQKPLQFFGICSAVLFLTSIYLAWPLFWTYIETGVVPRLPTAILVTGLMVTSLLALTSGVILDSVSRGRRDSKRMHYLAVPAFTNRGISAYPKQMLKRAIRKREPITSDASSRSDSKDQKHLK